MKLLRKSFGFYLKVIKSLCYTTFYHFSFAYIGKNVFIFSPLKIEGKKNIIIKNNVHLYYKIWLMALPLTGSKECNLIIGSGSTIGNFNHIIATQKIVIGNNVLTADKVYISDNIHSYKDINIPIKNQPIVQKKNVYIGDNSWLGENVCVIGASIGKHCVIGANSVVTKDIPDYSIAVGSPAKIIKKYDFKKEEWIKC